MRKKFLLILISCILYLTFCLNLFLSYENITEYGRFTGLVQAAIYYPSDDKSCISVGVNWEDGGNCTDIFVVSLYSPNVWTNYVGQDVLVWNDESRPVFKFEHNMPPGSVIGNATFCAYVYWGHCNQVAPRYMCGLGDAYASHIYVPGAIGVPDYNSSVLGSERVWLPDKGNSLIGDGQYWCVDATEWVADDVANGRGSTSVRLHITQHHVIKDNWASQLRIYSRLHNLSRPYLDVEYEYEVPSPTNRSVVITNSEWENVVVASAVKVPVLVSDGESVSPQMGRFLQEYGTDRIYTLGFSSGLDNSFLIGREDIPGLFFPNATKAVYANSREKGIFAGLVGYYLGAPVILENGGYPEIVDLENMSIQEIQGLYLSKVRGNGGNVDYLVLSDLDSSEGLLAGRLAGFRKGYIVPVGADKNFEGIRKKISDSVDVLGLKRLFYGHVEYKAGKPLYLGILGGNVSIPYVWFFDPGMEILDDRDGWWLYSDLRYADSNGDGFFDLAEGRMEGLEAASLHMAREFLPKNQSAVLIGEYRHPKFQDMKFFGGGMTQAFLVELALDSANVSTRRIVEERIQVLNATTEEEASAKLGELFAVFSLKSLSGIPGLAWSIADLLDDRMMYPILEYNWINWSGRYIGIIPVPVHLDVIDDNIGQKIDASGIVGYFGVGGKGWIIPRRDRFYAELVFGPYEFGDNFSNLTFSGFLYNDHDMSASSGITENVIREGGSVLASSGIVHDPYSIGTSTIFFGRLAYGKPLGEALLDSVNINMVENTFGSFFLSPLWAPSGDLWGAFTSGSVYIKDKVERILFSDPAVRPVEKGITPYKITYRTGPADSFKAESWIKSNYTLGEGRLEFWNADDYLMVRERPVIPVFVREFVLPESSVLNWVNVSGIYLLENVTPDFVYNDSYYTNYTAIILDCVNSLNLSGLLELNASQEGLILECMESAARPNVSYSYPNATFWWSSHSLLDNRTLVYVFVPALIYENENYGRVLESARIEVDYEALVEMNVFAHDFFAGVNGTVEVELMNMGPEATGKLWIFVEGDENFEFSDNVTMSGNSSLMREFSFAPGIGYYEVIAVFELENGSVGPRYAYFSVEEPPKLEVVSIPELVVDEGESGYFQVKLKNNGSFRLENVNISYEGPFDFDFGSSGFDMEPGGEMMVNGNVHAPEGQASGKYSGVLDFRPLNDRNVSINITVNVPARAVPEVDDNEWLVKIKPGRYSEKSFALGNSGNVPLEVGVSCEMVGISCSPVPGIVEVLPREEGYFSVNVSVPGGYPTDQYSGTIMLMGNGFSQPPKMEIPIKVSVPEVAYWSVQPADWACVLPDCEKVFAVANSPDSNTPVHGEISLEGLPFVSVQDEVVVVPGQEKGVPVSAGIPGEGILSGIYTGNISFECYGNSEPEEQKVGVTILAGGPEFTLQKKFFPEKIMLFWKQFVVPKTNHVEIYINNRGEIPIEKINVSDEIPDGWNGKKPVLAFVKRNRSTPVKEFSYSYANGYANFSFNLSGKPLSNGEGIVIHYLIYSQPESIPAGDIVTQISGEARSHENIYSRGVSSATLKVEYFDPPTWLRWLFILIYRLW